MKSLESGNDAILPLSTQDPGCVAAEGARGGKGGSWRAEQGGGENLMSVLWLYRVIGQPWLLELADLLYQQIFPWTQVFLKRYTLAHRCDHPGNPYDVQLLHCRRMRLLKRFG